MAVVNTKREMYELFGRGAFGNSGVNFDTVEEAEQFSGLVAIRSKKGPRGPAEFNIQPALLRSRVQHWQHNLGHRLEDMQFSGMMPDCNQRLVMQGFVMRSINYLDLDYFMYPQPTWSMQKLMAFLDAWKVEHVPPDDRRGICVSLEAAARAAVPVSPSMRDVQAHFMHAEGLEAVCLLKHAFHGPDYDDLMELFDTYPDSVIEFSAYQKDVGNCKHRKVVIWEVRNY